jgi:hypothetical protein
MENSNPVAIDMQKAMEEMRKVVDSYQLLLNLLALLLDTRTISEDAYPKTFHNRMDFASKFGPKTE